MPPADFWMHVPYTIYIVAFHPPKGPPVLTPRGLTT